MKIDEHLTKTGNEKPHRQFPCHVINSYLGNDNTAQESSYL